MSIKVMAKVWDGSSQKGSTLLLLLAIADFADENGRAWPSIETLAKKIRMSTRSAQMMVRKLVEDGELQVEQNAGPHGCNVYHVICLEGEKIAGVKTLQGEKIVGGGEKYDTKGVKSASPDPSIEPSNDPPIIPNGIACADSPKQKRERSDKQKRQDVWVASLEYALEFDAKIPGAYGRWLKTGAGYEKAGYTPEDVRTWKEFVWPTTWRCDKGHKPSKLALDEGLPDIKRKREDAEAKAQRTEPTVTRITMGGKLMDAIKHPDGRTEYREVAA